MIKGSWNRGLLNSEAIRLKPDLALAPLRPRQGPATRGSARRRSPSSEQPSGSSPMTTMLTTISASDCSSQGKLEEAIAEFRTAIRLKSR